MRFFFDHRIFMQKKGLVWSAGFALFSMFFGSGNLVFPLTVGYESQGHYFWGALGIILTGVVVPFLGVLGMMLHKGSLESFFAVLGKKGTLIFSFCLLALMGPFGVLARCLTVAHGALLLLFPSIPLGLTSLLLCVIIFFLTVNENKTVSIIGTFLTPFLLLSIGTIVFFGLQESPTFNETAVSAWPAFSNGFFKGYYIMDLLAAFFFSQFIIQHLFKITGNDQKQSLAIFFKAALVGAGLLASIYFFLVLLGWYYAPLLQDKPAQEFLGLIAIQSLGNLAGPIVCLAVMFACLTTAIILTTLFANFLKNELFPNRLSFKFSSAITLGIGCAVSILEFEGISKILGPVIEIIYPGLIILTLLNIVLFFKNKKTLFIEKVI